VAQIITSISAGSTCCFMHLKL